jgi:hypothetical protein
VQETKTAKLVNGKAINGNMLLGLAIEYCAALTAGAKVDLIQLSHSIHKVASEESERQ